MAFDKVFSFSRTSGERCALDLGGLVALRALVIQAGLQGLALLVNLAKSASIKMFGLGSPAK